MAHRWDPYFQSIPPLSSDSGTVRRTSESDGTLSQNSENFTGHHDFSGTVASQEAPVSHPNLNKNYCSSPSIENLRSDCAYERYCDTQWQDDKQLEKNYLQRCENDFSNFATDEVPTSGTFYSSCTSDFQELKQNCEMLPTSCLDYSSVSSCSDTDADEEEPSCTFIGSVNHFSKQKTEIPSADGSAQLLSKNTENSNLQTNSGCPNMTENNINTSAEHAQSSTTSFMTTPTRSETVHHGENDAGFQDIQQKEVVQSEIKEDAYQDVLMTRNLTGDGMDHCPVAKEEDDQNKSTTPILVDIGQGFIDEKNVKETRNESAGSKNPGSSDDQGTTESESVHLIQESLTKQSGSLDQKPSDEQKILTPNSTKSEDKIVKNVCSERNIQQNVSQSSDLLAHKESSFELIDHKLRECNSSSGSSHDLEPSLPEQQSFESPAQDGSCTILAEMDYIHLKAATVANFADTDLQPNKSDSDLHTQKEIKKNEEFTAAPGARDDLDCCGSGTINSSSSSDEEKKNVASDVLSDIQTHGADTDENSQIDKSAVVAKSIVLYEDADCDSPTITNDITCEDTNTENHQDTVTPKPYYSSTVIPSTMEMERIPLEKRSTNSSPDFHAPDVTSDSLANDINIENNTKDNTSNFDSCLKPDVSGTNTQDSLKMGSPPKTDVQSLPLNQDGDPSVTCNSLSNKSSLQSDGLNVDLHPCLSKELASHYKRASTSFQEDSKSDTLTVTPDNNMQSVSESLETCLQSNDLNTDIESCPENELIHSEETTNSTSLPTHHELLHESVTAQEEVGPCDDFYDNARESFEKLDFSTQDQLEPGLLYGEPLSGEDSLCDVDETNLVPSQHEEKGVKEPDEDGIGQLERPVPELTSYVDMRKLLHPVVILTTLESTNETSNSYSCADCQHTSHSVEHLIEHHYCNHPMSSFQYCKSCNVFQMKNELDENHLCGVVKESPPLSPQKQNRQFGRHKCTKCGIRFSKIFLYIRHMRTHTGKTPFRCNGCGVYFSQSGSLQRHRSIPGRCKQSKLAGNAGPVGKTKTSPQQNEAQNISIENMKKCYVKLIDIAATNLCHLCGRHFFSSRQVKKHIYHVHKRKRVTLSSNESATNDSIGNPPKMKSEMHDKYKCPLCPRLFKYSYNRARHLRDCIRIAVHGGKNKVGDKFACPLCKATFTATSNRYRHLKTNCMRDCLNQLAKEREHLRQKKKNKALEPQSKEDIQKTELTEAEPEEQAPPVLIASKCSALYKCNHCPAVFLNASGKYRHMKKHELFNLTGKMFKYRNSVFSFMPKQETKSSTTAEHCNKQSEKVQENVRKIQNCRFCGLGFSLWTTLKKHERSHRGERPYRCLECGKGFKKRCHLFGHKIVHQKRIQCTVCPEVFQTVGELLQHRSSHLRRGKIQCPDCPAQYDYPAHLLRHLKTHKNTDEKPSQPEEVKPLLPQQLVEFVSDKAPKQLQCSLCEEVCDDAHALRKHSLTHISGSSSPQCPFCKKSFPGRRNVLRHMTRHTGDKTFTCNNCGKQFYRSLYLKIHSQKCLPPHTNFLVGTKSISTTYKRYECSICPRSFCKRDRLQNHIHGHKKNILSACSRCGQYFGRTKISRHIALCGETADISTDDNQANNAINNSSQTSMNICKTPSFSKDSKIIQYKCPCCAETFRYRSIFLRHFVKHTGVQPYACTCCARRFKSQALLFKHGAVCDGENDPEQSKLKSEGEKEMDSLREATKKHPSECEPEYKCKFCTKVFIKPRNLRRHILTHNEVKPYRCKACDSCFSRYDHLKVHHARCKGKKTRLEVRIPKISLEDVGRGWQTRVDVKPLEKQETFNCEVCLKSFPAQSKLSRHFTMFHAVKPFKCTRCGSAFSHEKTLKSHRKMRKCKKPSSETKGFPTQESSQPTDNATKPLEEIRNRILLKIQPVVNKKFKHVCAYCPRSFKHSWQLNVHNRLHTGEKPFSCEYCEEKFIRRDYLVRHHLKCVKKRQRNKCDGCGGLYPENEIEDHKTICRLRPYSCKYCGKKFSRKDRMRHHSFKCDKKLQSSNVLCDRCGGFFPDDKLEDHKKSCTSKPSTTPVFKSQPSTPQNPPKGFSCAYCSSRFLLFSQLQEHFLSMHREETLNPSVSTAPLQQLLSNLPNIKEEPVDESCDKKLAVDAICKLVKVPKSDTIPQYVCPQCNMVFTNKAGLAGHQRVHATETPFKCKMCNRGFWNKTVLRNHYRKCKSSTDQQLEGPLKAEIEFALHDSDFDIKDTESTEALQTYKEDSEDESSHSSFGNRVQSTSTEKLIQYQCSECDKSFTDGLMLISHLEDHGREEQVKKKNICPKCGKACSSQANLDKHMKIHEVSPNYSCAICSKAFSTISDLEKHKTSHDVSKPFSCKLCQQRFWTRSDVCDHYREEHADNVFYCQFCNNVYAIKKSLIEHYKHRHEREWKELGSAVLAKGSSSEHQSSSHVSTTGESNEEDHVDNADYDSDSDNDSDSAPYFPCHVCGKTFPTSESLEDHQLCHLGKKPHECAECGKCFVQASQLQQHQRMHKSEFQCQTCGRGFVTLFALRTHKHSHGKSRPHRCSKCDLSFTGPMQLAEHMSTHREESFPCDICNKVFQSKSSRAEHRKSHAKSDDYPSAFIKGEHEESESLFGYSSEFRYRCGICSERFRDPEELSEHGCMEAKERPYSCTNCNKHFLHSSHLKKHMNTHEPSWSDREYPCNQCNSSFSSPQNFIRHLESHVDTATGIESKGESSDGHICPVCHQCFASATELIHHFPTHPDNAPKRQRIKLDPSGSELKKHEWLFPTSTAEYECTKCGGKFGGGSAFQGHHCCRQQQGVVKSKYSDATDVSPTHRAAGEEEDVDVTGEDLYTCNDCSMQFSSKSSLLDHQNKLHSDGKSFRCDHCGKTFAKMRYLKKHENRHRLKELPINTAELLEKKFKCTRCSTKFSTAEDLSSHMRLHAEKEVGEYRCDMCYKSFSKQILLRQHQESHVGEVVYECTECDKAFAFPHLLEEHQQTHARPSE